METAITALILIGLLIIVVVGLSQHSLAAQALISESSRSMQDRVGERTRTAITPLAATTTPAGDYVTVTIKNTGSTKLADFSQWDVLLQYTDVGGAFQAKWYAYSTQWTRQIYQTASPPTPEGVEPDILNPGEEMVITIPVSPAVGTPTTNLATVTTPNGVTTSAIFTR